MGRAERIWDPPREFAYLWGEYEVDARPERMALIAGFSLQTVVGSKRMLNNANFAKYNLAVSQVSRQCFPPAGRLLIFSSRSFYSARIRNLRRRVCGT